MYMKEMFDDKKAELSEDSSGAGGKKSLRKGGDIMTSLVIEHQNGEKAASREEVLSEKDVIANTFVSAFGNQDSDDL